MIFVNPQCSFVCYFAQRLFSHIRLSLIAVPSLWVICLISPTLKAQDSLEIEEDSIEAKAAYCETEDHEFIFQDQGAFHPAQMKDPIFIQLFHVDEKKFWAPPLLNTQLKTSNFGLRWGKFHHGVDLGLRTGAPVMSVFDGIVKLSTYGGGYGNYIIIRHENGLETLYAHLHQRKVSVGQRVQAGDLIGWGGSTGYSTGPHLHFEVRYKGYTFNPLLLYDFKKKYQIRSDRFFLQPHHFRHYGNATEKKHYVFYEVGQNETIEIIAQRYQISTEQIIRLNRLSNPKLQSGQIIRLN
ncbi:MAG: peptidoglycan DD-metalloendopeptidase family protein [Microscillaceae bacterium]|nr:peptidoglycan DD-metalloendopeptidase family protein [Microscillaceae bacterium]